MSYREMLSHRSIAADLRAIMNDAYERAFADFPEANERTVVRTILTAALAGERDVERLSQFALLAMFDDD
jgi:hypothetical protein